MAEPGELGDPGVPGGQYEALTKDRADITFLSGGAEEWRQEGFTVLELDTLPMINGPTITSYEALRNKDRLAERLVRAVVLTIRYAHMHRAEAQQLLVALPGAWRRGHDRTVTDQAVPGAGGRRERL